MGWGEKADIGTGAFLVCLGDGEPDVFEVQEDGFPREVENFLRADEGVEGEDEEGIVVELEGVEGVD